MAQGRILAASDVGGHLELIADGKTGVLFKADDPASLADKVGALLESQQTVAGNCARPAALRRDRTQLAGQRGALQEHLWPPDGPQAA
jgi:glycosyltransferase involved in cell wall biosynthesis